MTNGRVTSWDKIHDLYVTTWSSVINLFNIKIPPIPSFSILFSYLPFCIVLHHLRYFPVFILVYWHSLSHQVVWRLLHWDVTTGFGILHRPIHSGCPSRTVTSPGHWSWSDRPGCLPVTLGTPFSIPYVKRVWIRLYLGEEKKSRRVTWLH